MICLIPYLKILVILISITFFEGVVWCRESCTNLPVTVGGTLIATKRSDTSTIYCTQTFISIEPKIYYRSLDKGVWSDWSTLSSTNDISANYYSKSATISTDMNQAQTPSAGAYGAAPICLNANSTTSRRAGIGFHNSGFNGAYLYLELDNRLYYVLNNGRKYDLLLKDDLIHPISIKNFRDIQSIGSNGFRIRFTSDVSCVIFNNLCNVSQITFYFVNSSNKLIQFGTCTVNATSPEVMTTGSERLAYVNTTDTSGYATINLTDCTSCFYVGGQEGCEIMDIYVSKTR